MDQSLQSATGCHMVDSYEKSFTVSAEDFESPDLDKWEMIPPRRGTQDWLRLDLNGAHDHVSLAYQIRVVDEAGKAIPGYIALAENERQWRFKPSTAWEDNDYRILVNSDLEDIAGNRLTGSFEKPITKTTTATFFLSFRPK